MTSKVSLLVISTLVSMAVGAAPIQTEPLESAPVWPTTSQPQPVVTYKSIVNQIKVGNRNGQTADPTPLIKLTPCAQAILGCCAPEVKHQQNCFEEIGCGPHIFDNPCDKPFMNQALGGAERFYSQFVPPPNN